jgi:hypothetical protein
MTIAAEDGRVHRLTWRDWAGNDPPPPDDELLTKEDIIDWSAGTNFPVADREFRYLQNLGVLPRPILRRRAGVRVGLYPDWVRGQLLNAVAMRREYGYPWDKVKKILRTPDRDHPVLLAGAPDPETSQAWTEPPKMYVVKPREKPIPPIIHEALRALAEWAEGHTGQAVARIEVNLLDGQGASLASLAMVTADSTG